MGLKTTVRSICEKLGYKIIQWDVDTNDWQNRSTTAMMSTIRKGTGDGSIILMHDRRHKGGETVLEATKQTVEEFRAKGYTFVTVGELIGLDHRPAAAAVSIQPAAPAVETSAAQSILPTPSAQAAPAVALPQ